MSQHTWLDFFFSFLDCIKSLSHLTWHSLCPAKREKTRPHEENLNEGKQLLVGAVIELSLPWPHEEPDKNLNSTPGWGGGFRWAALASESSISKYRPCYQPASNCARARPAYLPQSWRDPEQVLQFRPLTTTNSRSHAHTGASQSRLSRGVGLAPILRLPPALERMEVGKADYYW